MVEHLQPGDRIARDAWNKNVGKQVDLVIYKGGQRIVIGRAEIKPEGKIDAQVAKDVRKDVWDIIKDRVGDISINPKLGE